MKARFFALLLAAMLLLSVPAQAIARFTPAPSTTPAATETPSSLRKILFRGVEWGATFETVISTFPSKLEWWSLDEDSSYSIRDHMLGTHNRYYGGHVCCYTSARSYTLNNFQVAGYDVSYIQLRFAYVPGENGLIVADAKHTALYYAEYRIKPRNTSAVFDDLTKKLSSLYGEDYEDSHEKYNYLETYRTWYGENGTMVTLFKDIGSSTDTIEIRYGFDGADNLLRIAQKALEYQESLTDAENIDGL